jgi:hypothetical protein
LRRVGCHGGGRKAQQDGPAPPSSAAGVLRRVWFSGCGTCRSSPASAPTTPAYTPSPDGTQRTQLVQRELRPLSRAKKSCDCNPFSVPGQIPPARCARYQAISWHPPTSRGSTRLIRTMLPWPKSSVRIGVGVQRRRAECHPGPRCLRLTAAPAPGGHGAVECAASRRAASAGPDGPRAPRVPGGRRPCSC